MDKDIVKDEFPLAQYAAEHWVDHAQFGNVSSHIREATEHIFDPDKPHFASWLEVHDVVTQRAFRSVLDESVDSSLGPTTPPYYAAFYGFHHVAEQLIIKHPQQVYATGGYFMSPLGAALMGGHLGIAQVLYERGARH